MSMKNILCFGDSNTFGYDTINDSRFPWGVRWTSILQEMLGIGQTSFGIYMGGASAVERSKQFPGFYREIARKNGFEFMAASDYARPCREDAMHMDAENHRNLATAVGNKILRIFADEGHVKNNK